MKTKGNCSFTLSQAVILYQPFTTKTAWQTWDICPEASPIFTKLSQYPPVLTDGDLEILEKFVVLMYDRWSTAVSVDEARLDMFARKQRPYEAIPPTSAAPQHTKRAAYQAGCIWAQATQRQPKQRVLLTGDGKRLVGLLDSKYTSCTKLSTFAKCGCKSE